MNGSDMWENGSYMHCDQRLSKVIGKWSFEMVKVVGYPARVIKMGVGHCGFALLYLEE